MTNLVNKSEILISDSASHKEATGFGVSLQKTAKTNQPMSTDKTQEPANKPRYEAGQRAPRTKSVFPVSIDDDLIFWVKNSAGDRKASAFVNRILREAFNVEFANGQTETEL